MDVTIPLAEVRTQPIRTLTPGNFFYFAPQGVAERTFMVRIAGIPEGNEPPAAGWLTLQEGDRKFRASFPRTADLDLPAIKAPSDRLVARLSAETPATPATNYWEAGTLLVTNEDALVIGHMGGNFCYVSIINWTLSFDAPPIHTAFTQWRLLSISPAGAESMVIDVDNPPT